METPAPSTNLTPALIYAQRGWRVFPIYEMERGMCACRANCHSPGKHPRVKTGLMEATTDPAQIEAWWTTWPYANIGVATGRGSNLLVLDVDVKHSIELAPGILVSEGQHSLDALESEYGDLPATLMQQTGSGGVHYLFWYPDDGHTYGNRTHFAPSLDIRGEGGYILVAPSNHRSGNQYAWIGDAPIADPPDWLLALLRDPWKAAPVVSAEAFEVAERVGEGGRNHYLFRYAARERGEHGLEYQELLDRVLAHNAAVCDPPLDPREVDTIVKSVIRRYAPNDPDPVWDVPPGAVDFRQPPPIPEGGDLLPDLAAFLSHRPPPPPPLIDDLLGGGEAMIVAGQPNIGKSWLTMDMALAVASGQPFLDRFATHPGPVIFIDEEGSHTGDASRYDRLLEGRDIGSAANIPLYLGVGRHIKLDAEVGQTVIGRLVDRYRPKLVIYDSLVRAHDGDENVSREMARFFEVIKAMLQTSGIAWVFTHHVRKPNLLDGSDPADLMRGSSEIRAFPDVVLMVLPGEDDTELKLINAKQRERKKLPPMTARLLIDETRASVAYLDEAVEGELNDAQAPLLLALENATKWGDPATVKSLADQLNWAEKTVRRKLAKLVSVGLVIQTTEFLPGQPTKPQKVYRLP